MEQMIKQLFEKYPEKRVTFINNLNHSETWKSWKKFVECSKEDLTKINLRQIFPNEIILDFEDKTQIEETKARLESLGLNYTMWDTGSRGVHFRIFFSNLENFELEKRNEIRKIIIKEFNSDPTKASENTLIALEDRPHYKTMKNKVLILDNSNTEANAITENYIVIADKNIEKFKEISSELKDEDFKNYHLKDSFFKYISENIIGDGMSRNNTIFKNIAVALIKEGLTEQEIFNLMNPIILKNFPGKTYNEFNGWLQKAIYKTIKDYNLSEVNLWGKMYTQGPSFYDLSPVTIDDEYFDFDSLEKEINNTPKFKFLEKINEYLKKIKNLNNWAIQNHFINIIARKTFINKRELLNKLEKLEDISIKTYNIDELFNLEVPKMNFFVKPIIPKKSLIFIGGMFGHFKSMFVTSLVLYSLFEFKFIESFKREEIPRVLVYDKENDISVMASRIQSILKGNNIDKDEVSKVMKQLTVINDFDCIDLKKEVERAMPYDLIVLDSYRRFLNGNENDSEVSNKFYVDFIKPLRDLGKSIIIIHHLKKFGKEELDEDFLMQLFRGTGDIIAQADLAFILFKNEGVSLVGEDTNIFDVNVIKVKNRYGINISKDISFKVETKEEDSIVKSARFSSSTYRKLAPPKIKAKNEIVELIKTNGVMTRNKICENFSASSGLSDISIFRYLKELVSEGILIQPEFGHYKIANFN